jgi:hypothetical protein
MEDDSPLERGYRRLLALYPARYRSVHEEEMLASSAAPRPVPADVLETSGLGALCGVLTGAAVAAVALIPRRRRLRVT